MNKFISVKEIEGVINFEPYLTMRGHVSEIMSFSGFQGINPLLENIVLSGSRDGAIKAWRVPQMH